MKALSVLVGLFFLYLGIDGWSTDRVGSLMSIVVGLLLCWPILRWVIAGSGKRRRQRGTAHDDDYEGNTDEAFFGWWMLFGVVAAVGTLALAHHLLLGDPFPAPGEGSNELRVICVITLVGAVGMLLCQWFARWLESKSS